MCLLNIARNLYCIKQPLVSLEEILDLEILEKLTYSGEL